MNRVTYEMPDGTFGINGVNLRNQPLPVQNAVKKLLEYEKTGLEPEQIFKMDRLYREMCEALARYEKGFEKVNEQLDQIIEKILHASDLTDENLAEILRMPLPEPYRESEE